MANPSLQIGNDNWAIKEDNLLGYSTAGTRFVPQPITMTRATLGTRVNPSGLVEDVELLGSELVTNGDFATDSDWDKLNATISGGQATVTIVGGASSYITQTLSYISGQKYKLTVTINGTSGKEIKFQDRGNNTGGLTITNGTVTLDGSDQNIEIYWIANSNSNGIVIGRSSSGDYSFTVDNVSVKEATIDNLPRVDYTDGTSSLLVEPQRTNLITSSEDFSGWSKNQIVVTTISETSPLGGTVSKVVGANNSTLKLLYKNNFINSSKVFSVLVKKSGYDFASIRIGSGGGTVIFDLVNGVVGDMTSGLVSTDYKIEDYGSGWFRLSARFPAFTGDTYMSITGVASNSIYSTTGNGVDGILLAYAQIEEGSYPTSYIPTSGSTVTRNQETYTKTGISDKINSTEGVLFLEMSALSNDGTNKQISISDGTSSQRIYFGFRTTDNEIIMSSNNVASGSYNSVTHVLNNATLNNKFAFKYKENDFALWVNGVEVGTDLIGVVPTGLNKLSFDNGSGSSPFYGKVKQLQIFKTALSDSELATLTT